MGRWRRAASNIFRQARRTVGSLRATSSDAHQRDIGVVHHGLHARRAHLRAAHAEKAHIRAGTQRCGESRGVHIAGGFAGGDQKFGRRHQEWRSYILFKR